MTIKLCFRVQQKTEVVDMNKAALLEEKSLPNLPIVNRSKYVICNIGSCKTIPNSWRTKYCLPEYSTFAFFQFMRNFLS